MTAFIETASSGWIAALAFVVVAALPYLLRRVSVGMWFHYLLAFGVVGAALVHAWLPMSARMMRGVEPAGLWFATAALALLLVQLGLGVVLKGAEGQHIGVRRSHFAVMTGALVLIALHVALDRA